MTIEKLIARGVVIPAPGSVVCTDIDIGRIMPGAVLYPGTVIRGRETFIGRRTEIGAGGGALIENVQVGADAVLMQGAYRDSTLLDGVHIRNGAELRDNCLLEEGADLGHTVGLKQTILFPDVVLGSLINFCDVLMSGGTDRKNHSEVGSCTALYNFTPQGDKFASLFGDVQRGLFLRERPIFIGGQTQIISPVHVGFGSVIAAGTKLSHNVDDNTLVAETFKSINTPFDPDVVYSPDKKIETTLKYIENLKILWFWYRIVRQPLFAETESAPLFDAAVKRIEACIVERTKRLKKFVKKLNKSLDFHQKTQNLQQIESHMRVFNLLNRTAHDDFSFDLSPIVENLKQAMNNGMSYVEAVRNLPDEMCRIETNS